MNMTQVRGRAGAQLTAAIVVCSLAWAIPSYAADCAPLNGITLSAASSEETQTNPKRFARYVLDGDPATFWHSAWMPVGSQPKQPPHWIRLDLGGTYSVCGVELVGRQDGGKNGAPTVVSVAVSDGGTTYRPVIQEQLYKSGDDVKATRRLMFPTEQLARGVEVRVLASYTGPWASLSEARVLVKPVAVPDPQDPVHLGTISIRWSPVDHPRVTGYRVGWGASSRIYDQTRDVACPQAPCRYVISGLHPELRYWISVATRYVPVGATEKVTSYGNELANQAPVEAPVVAPGDLVRE